MIITRTYDIDKEACFIGADLYKWVQDGGEAVDKYFRHANIREARWSTMSLRATSFADARFANCLILGCVFTMVDFSDADFTRSTFAGCAFPETNFWEAYLYKTTFFDCDFTKAKAGRLKALGARFINCRFSEEFWRVLAEGGFTDLSIVSCKVFHPDGSNTAVDDQ